jgi:DNA-binding MarR family transcriptional regulator
VLPDEFDENGEIVEMKKDALSGSDYEALANLRYTLRRFMDFSTSAAQEEGLPSQQHQALLAIKGHLAAEAMTIGMLANRLLIAPHTATELVGRLSAAGLVARNSDPEDKRRQTLILTEKAEAALLRLSAVHLKEIREMAPELITILQRLQKKMA